MTIYGILALAFVLAILTIWVASSNALRAEELPFYRFRFELTPEELAADMRRPPHEQCGAWREVTVHTEPTPELAQLKAAMLLDVPVDRLRRTL